MTVLGFFHAEDVQKVHILTIVASVNHYNSLSPFTKGKSCAYFLINKCDYCDKFPL